MTAFLEKLRRIVESCPSNVGGWSPEGTEFEVYGEEFEPFLKKFFKGTVKTFIRQLHFYGFTKSESVDGKWAFSHPKMRPESIDEILEISRRTKLTAPSGSAANSSSAAEIDLLKAEVRTIKNTLLTEVTQINQKLAMVMNALGLPFEKPPYLNPRQMILSPALSDASMMTEDAGLSGFLGILPANRKRSFDMVLPTQAAFDLQKPKKQKASSSEFNLSLNHSSSGSFINQTQNFTQQYPTMQISAPVVTKVVNPKLANEDVDFQLGYFQLDPEGFPLPVSDFGFSVYNNGENENFKNRLN